MNRFSLTNLLYLTILLFISVSCTNQQKDFSHNRLTELERFTDHPDSLQAALDLFSDKEKENGFLDYLYMKAYANIGDYHRMDSMYHIASDKFKKQHNRFMLFDTKFSYASSLNGAQQFDKAHTILLNLLQDIKKYKAEIPTNT